MSSTDFYFENPLFLFALIPAFLLILLPFFRLPKNRRKSAKKIVPVILHLIIAILLVMILSGFSLLESSQQQAVMILADMSHSTAPAEEDILSTVDRLLEEIDVNASVGVIAFGGDRVQALPLGDDRNSLTLPAVNESATDLASAIEYAASLLPSDMAGRIILLTDGKETDGDALRSAQFLSNRGIRIDAMYYDASFGLQEMQIGSFSGPDTAFIEDEILFTAEIRSNTDGQATLSLYDNYALQYTTDVSVTAGSNVVELPMTASEAGIRALRLQLSSDGDSQKENNVAYACLRVEDEVHVLIIANSDAQAKTLGDVLPEPNVVTTVAARNAPRSIVELCEYDEIILANVNYSALPAGYDKLLEDYVANYGRSLLAVGGVGTFMYGNMKGTAVESLLPVSLFLNESEEGNSVALFLVMDTSSSMSVGSGSTTNLLMAKQGAIRCVESLSKNDYVGVISFNSDAYLKAPLAPATSLNKSTVSTTVSALTTSGGTNYTEALKLAHAELLKSDAAVKHILFLSDGQPGDTGYKEAAAAAGRDGISVSTIGLGYASGALMSMAEKSGGRYYYVESAYDLPSIMLSETRQVASETFITGQFTPVIHKESPLTEELPTTVLPTLTGYLGTTLKDGATAYLTFENGHPLYASWAYGKGKVGCFTSDLNGNWSSAWFKDEIGLSIIASMVETVAGDGFSDSSLSMEALVRGMTVELAVTTSGNTENTLSVKVLSDTEENVYDLVQASPGLYKGTAVTGTSGLYKLTVTESDPDGNVVDTLESAVAVSYSAEYDAFAPSGKTILEGICAYSEGFVAEDTASLTQIQMPAVQLSRDPTVYLAFPAAILLLADVAMRRIRWRDLREAFKKWFRRSAR